VFDRLDADARRVLVLAQEEARGFAHNYIGTEHVLIGLTRDDGSPGELLAALGCGVDDARAAVDALIGRGVPHRREPEALLAAFGIDLGEVRRRIEATFGAEAMTRAALRARPRARWRRRLPWPGCRIEAGSTLLHERWLGVAPRLKRVVEMATKEATPALTTPAHLLWAIAEEGEGVACQILADRGIDLAHVAAAARAHFP
jgi:ATP-dependent Clp protease ATP-binding subunit ClpA